jgi:mono/diheme cytochrome c family protein
MLSRILAVAMLLISVSGFGHAEAQTKPVLKSVKVVLPDGDRVFPGGAAADVVNNNCLACHSTEMVLTQPALAKPAWEAVVRKMIAVYKAPIDDADIAAIVSYLVQNKGKTVE